MKDPTTIVLQVRAKDNTILTSALFNFNSDIQLTNIVDRVLPLLFQADTAEVEINTLNFKLGEAGVTIENSNKKRHDHYRDTGN